MNFVHFNDRTHLNLDTVDHVEQVKNNNGELHGVIVSWSGIEGEAEHSFFEKEKAKLILSHLARHTVEK